MKNEKVTLIDKPQVVEDPQDIDITTFLFSFFFFSALHWWT